jgi:cell division protein FtsB
MNEGSPQTIAELERRVEELRRANAELGRELIAARSGRSPRSESTAGRGMAKLIQERERAEAERDGLQGEIGRLRHENDVLRAEAHRMRAGATGLARRLRARLLRR